MEHIKSALAEVDTTKIFFSDLNGRIRGLSINPDDMEKIAARGIGFDGSSVPGFATVDDSDRFLLPVLDSFRIVDFFDRKLGFFIGEVRSHEETNAESDPRALLSNVVDTAGKEFGYRFRIGPEYEFFLIHGRKFEKAGYTDNAGYFHLDPDDNGDTVRETIVRILRKSGISFEKDHHEVSPSQHEINFGSLSPIDAADQTLLFMHVAKKVASRFGYNATFMPKPLNGHNRSAFHMHLSMQDKTGRNVFFQADDECRLSRTARQFIGGFLKYARETSIVMASTFNSYKAYTVDREAPIACGWGIKNRSSMVRVPYASDPAGTRIELRSPDPAGNVYLQMAVFIAMGLQGIRENADPGDPDNGSVYEHHDGGRVVDRNLLPRSMYEALAEAESGNFLRDLLGERLFGNYLSLKIKEWEFFRTNVTPLEFSSYLSL